MNKKAIYIVLTGGIFLLLYAALHIAAVSGVAPWWGFSEHYIKTTSNIDMTGGSGRCDDYKLVASSGGGPFETGFAWFGMHRNYPGYLYTLGNPEFIDVLPGDIDPFFGSPDFNVEVLPRDRVVIHPDSPMKGRLMLETEYSDSATYTVWINSLHGFSAPVTLSLQNQCCGLMVDFDPPVVTPPQGGVVSSTMTLKATSSTAVGAYSLIVLGIDETGVLHHTGEFRLRVIDKPDYDLEVLQDTTHVGQRNATLATIFVTSLAGFNEAVFLSLSGLPEGVTAEFVPNPIIPLPDGQVAAILRLRSSLAADLGSYQLTVTGEAGDPIIHQDDVVLVIEESGDDPTITLSIDPPVTVAKPDSDITVCLFADDLHGIYVNVLYGELAFDTTIIRFDSTITLISTCLDSLGWNLTWHYKNGALDTLQFWLIGGGLASEGIECVGCLLKFGFVVDSAAPAGCHSLLDLVEVVFDGTPVKTVLEDGFVFVNRPPVILTSLPDTIYFDEFQEDCLEIVVVDVDNDSIMMWSDLDPDTCDGAFEDTVFGLGSTTMEFCWKPPKHGVCDTLDIEFIAMSTYTTGQPLYDRLSTTIIVRNCEIMVAWPDTAWHAGGWLEIPVRIHANYDLLSNLNVMSFFLDVCYDPELMTVGEVGNEGLVTEDWGALVFNIYEESGTIHVAMGGNYPLPQPGPPWGWYDIFYVGFWINPDAEEGDGNFLCIEDVKFNEGSLLACMDDGVFTVIRHGITGNVAMCSTDVPIENVLMTLTWDIDLDGTIDSVWTTLTDEMGDYEFFHLYGSTGEYCVTPSKEGDLGIQAITSYDATLILRSLVDGMSFDSCQFVAADVTGDGSVGAYDASTLLEYVVCGNCEIEPSHTWIIGTWTFIPPQLCYRSLRTDTTDQDYLAVLIGDVSENWPGPANPKALAGGIGVDVLDSEIQLTLSEPVSALDLTVHNTGGLKPVDVEIEGAKVAWRTAGNQLRIAAASAGDFSKVTIYVTDISHTTLNISGIIDEGSLVNTSVKIVPLPTEFALEQNYPNPFNPTTDIRYQIADRRSPVRTTLKIYNMLGQEMKTLVDEDHEVGYYSVTWDGRDDSGREVSSGVYFYRLQTEFFVSNRKMILMK